MRWMMLLLVSLTMFTVYVAQDLLAPLQTMLEQYNNWTASEYGFFMGSTYAFNVFLGMLIFGGIILDKKGIRFTGIVCSLLMLVGFSIKLWAITTPSLVGHTVTLFGSQYKSQVLLAGFGFAVFGIGTEVIGATVSKTIVKWFKGKELALAMGMQLSLARLGTAVALSITPVIAARAKGVGTPVQFGLALLFVGFLLFILYTIYDKKLDHQIEEATSSDNNDSEGSFTLADVKMILKSKGFWLISILCVVFYSAVFPFLKYAAGMMEFKFNVDPKLSGLIPSILPFGTIILTPLFGRIYDKIGRGVDLMIIGSILLITVHLLFTMPFINQWWIAIILMILLGIAFSLLPSAMWPSLAKIIPEKQFGTAIALAFYVQNIGLMSVPMIIGHILNKYSVVGTVVKEGIEVNKYHYTYATSFFVLLSFIAIIVSFILKKVDIEENYKLQEANIEN